MLFKRALLQELVVTATGAFVILAGIVVAQRTGFLIRLAAKGALPNDAIATMLGFNMLKFLPMLFSLTLFLAVLMTLSRWYRDSEMVIWFSAGLSINKWIKPVLMFTLPVVLVIAVLSLYIMPWATNKADEFRLELKSRDDLATISPGVFKESKHADRVFFIESFDALGNVVKNIFVQSKQQNKLGIIVASKGSRFEEKNGDQFLLMENGRRYQGTKGTAEYSTTEFEKYAIRVEAAEVITEPPSTQAISSDVLIENQSVVNSAELQWRLAIPISALILTLLAIPLSSLDPRAGRSANFVMALVIYMIYNNLLSIMQAWVTQGKVSVMVGLWPVHAVFAALTAYMLYRRARQLPMIPSLKFQVRRSS